MGFWDSYIAPGNTGAGSSPPAAAATEPEPLPDASNPEKIGNVVSKPELPEGSRFWGAHVQNDDLTHAAIVRVMADGISAGKSFDEMRQRLEELGADVTRAAPAYSLGLAKQRLGQEGIGTLQSFRRNYMPFGGVADALGYTQGTNLPGGRVVGNKEYADAVGRLKDGKSTPDDIEAIATYERHADIDKGLKKAAGPGSGLEGFGLKLAIELGSLGKIGAEAATGAGVTGRVAGLVGIGRAAPVATAAAAGTAPAVPVAAAATSSLGQFGRYAAGKLAPTITTPSLYVPMMQQNNMANGRDPNDWKGLPSAFGYGYANMLVLGQLQKGLNGGGLREAAKKGILGTAEMQGVDIAAGLADEFLPKAYQVKPGGEGSYGNLGTWVKGVKAGSSEKQSEALRDATVQALSFGTFAAMHGRSRTGSELAQSYADAVGNLRKNGLGPDAAGLELSSIHERLEDQLSQNPYLTRDGARAAMMRDAVARGKNFADVKDYIEKLSQAFEPQVKAPAEAAKPPEPPVPAPEAPAAAAAAPEAAKPAASPEAPVTAPEPRAGESSLDYYGRITTENKVPPDLAAKLTRGLFPDGPKPAEAPAATTTPVAAAATPKPKAGARQPMASAATDSKAPGVALVEPKTEAAPTPKDTPIEPSASTGKAAEPIRSRGEWQTASEVANAEAATGKPRTYVDMDIDNMAGLAKHVGDPAAKLHVEAAVRIVHEELAKLGDAKVFRHAGDAKGDEHSAIVAAPKSAVDAALRTADARIKEYAKAHGLDSLPYFKKPSTIRPFGLTTFAEPFSGKKNGARVTQNEAGMGTETMKSRRFPPPEHAQLRKVGGEGDLNQLEPFDPAADLDARTGTGSVRDLRTGGGSALGQARNPAPPVAAAATPKAGAKKKPAAPAAPESPPEPPAESKNAEIARLAGEWQKMTEAEKAESPGVARRLKELGFEPPDAEAKRLSALWDMMTNKERRSAPEVGKRLEELGVDPKAVDKSAGRKAGQARSRVSERQELPDIPLDQSHEASVKSAEDLSATEKSNLIDALKGRSYDDIAKQTGVSKQAIEPRVNRAFAKIKSEDPGTWAEYETVQDAIEARKRDAIDREAFFRLRDRADVEKPAKLSDESPADAEPGTMFGGAPFRIAALDWLFSGGKGGRSVASRLKGLFFGNLPSLAAAARQQEMDSKIASYAFDVKNTEKDFHAALAAEGKRPEWFNGPGRMKAIGDVLRVEAKDTVATAVRNGFTAETGLVIKSMREQMNKLSEALVAVGAVDGPLVAVFEKNAGLHITRQYQVFRDPKWESKVEPAIVNTFKSWLTLELQKATKGPVDPDFVEAQTKSLLRDGTAAENPIAFLRNSVLGAKDLSILKARKDIPPELRALWGEYDDPLINYVNSVGKMAHLLTSHNFLTRVAAEGRNSFIFDAPRIDENGDHVHKIVDADVRELKPLSGKYVTKEVKEAFEKAFSKDAVGFGMRQYMKAVALAKFSKVVVSHVGQVRNFLSNVGIVVRNGLWQVGHLPTAVAALAKDTPASREYWRRGIELGIIDEGVHYNDFQKTVNDAIGSHDPIRDASGLVAVDTVLGRIAKGSAGFLSKWYRYGDAFWKVYAFEAERARYEKTGMSKAEAEARAAQIVRDTMPTYSQVPELLQKLRLAPFVAPFLAFQAEMVRTTKNTVKLAFQELRDPKTRGIGATRLAGVAAAAALPAALVATMRAAFGVDADEDKAVRRFVPEFQRDSDLVYVGRQANGQPKYIDLSKTDPHSYLTDGFYALFRGKDAAEGLQRAGDEWAKPFTQEELLVRPILDVARNQKEPGGKVYNPSDTLRERSLDVAGHMGKAFVPGGAGAVRRLYMAAQGQDEQKSGKKYDLGEAAQEQVSGQQIHSLDVERELSNKAHGFEGKNRDSVKIVNDLINARGAVKPEELIQAKARVEAGRAKALEDFRDDVAAAEKLGVSREKIARILKDAGLSAIEIGSLFNQSVPQRPYQPQLRGSATARERAGEVRKQAAP